MVFAVVLMYAVGVVLGSRREAREHLQLLFGSVGKV
jgi:hypothetical protein